MPTPSALKIRELSSRTCLAKRRVTGLLVLFQARFFKIIYADL
jgi:hypothetical protein